MAYSPQGHKELDMSERLDNNNSFILNLYHFSVPVPWVNLSQNSLGFLDLDVFPSSDWGSFQRLFLLIIFLSCSFSYPFGTPIMKMLFCLMLSPGPLKVALFLALLPWLGELLWSVSQSFDSLTPAVEPLWCVCQLRNMTVWFFVSLC